MCLIQRPSLCRCAGFLLRKQRLPVTDVVTTKSALHLTRKPFYVASYPAEAATSPQTRRYPSFCERACRSQKSPCTHPRRGHRQGTCPGIRRVFRGGSRPDGWPKPGARRPCGASRRSDTCSKRLPPAEGAPPAAAAAWSPLCHMTISRTIQPSFSHDHRQRCTLPELEPSPGPPDPCCDAWCHAGVPSGEGMLPGLQRVTAPGRTCSRVQKMTLS